MRNSHKDNVRSSAVGKQLKQKKSNSLAQLHLPTLDLFWANLRVQHHLPPLDLACTRKSVQILRESPAHLPPLFVGLLGTGAQDGHLDFHTTPELCSLLLISPGLCMQPSDDEVGLHVLGRRLTY